MHHRDCLIDSVQCSRVCLCGERPLMKVQPQPHWEPQDWRGQREKPRLGRHHGAESEHLKRIQEVIGEDGSLGRCRDLGGRGRWPYAIPQGQQQAWSGIPLRLQDKPRVLRMAELESDATQTLRSLISPRPRNYRI